MPKPTASRTVSATGSWNFRMLLSFSRSLTTAALISMVSFIIVKCKRASGYFIDELLGCTAPLSAGGQRDSFNALVEDTLGDDCRYDTVLSIHEKLNDLIESQKDEPEPVVLTKSEVKRLFEECGVEDENYSHLMNNTRSQPGKNPLWLLPTSPIQKIRDQNPGCCSPRRS